MAVSARSVRRLIELLRTDAGEFGLYLSIGIAIASWVEVDEALVGDGATGAATDPPGLGLERQAEIVDVRRRLATENHDLGAIVVNHMPMDLADGTCATFQRCDVVEHAGPFRCCVLFHVASVRQCSGSAPKPTTPIETDRI